MSDAKTCPKCGAEVPADVPAGICPKCLLLAGIAVDSEQGATTSAAGFMPAEPETLASQFPDLEILELLGHGGMGAVYKARQAKLDRLVALKIIRPEFAERPEFAARFHREARTLAHLNHPNIVAVYDFGEVTVASFEADESRSGTVYYFLMEYVDGTTLRQLIEAGRLRPQQALAIVPQICEALQFAHDEGVVHRDIKPENILLDQRGRVKIADFGLARLLNASPQDPTLTDAHQVMGTPLYMAPEQMEGSREVDHRADIFSLGVVFYEMLTGQRPAGHFEPPSKKVQIDVRLDDVVLRSMAREPERRYQQANEVKTEVEAISQGGPAKPKSVPSAAAANGGAAMATEGVDFVEVESDLNGPSIAMMVLGLLIAAGHAIGVTIGIYRWFDPELLLFGFLGIVVGVGMFVGGLNMRRLRSLGWARFGVIAGLIPASCGWLVGVWISIWAHWVLQRPQVRRAFIERARERQRCCQQASEVMSEVESDLGGPSTAMMVVGLLIAAGHTIAVTIGVNRWFDPELLLFGPPGIAIGVSMFVGGLNMRRLRSRGWAQFGVIAGVIPASAGWLVGVPIALWTHFVLRRPEVRRAFIERARQRQNGVIPSEPPKPSKSEQGSGGAIGWAVFHLVLWAALFCAFLRLVPGFQRIFDEFGVELPGLTVMMISVGYGLSHYWFVAVPLGMVGMALDFAVLFLLGKIGQKLQSLAGLLLALPPLVFIGLLLLSLGLPLVKLIEAMS